MKLDIISLEGKATGSIELPKSLFAKDLQRVDLMHRVVLWQQAARRAGTASTLTRGEIARTGAKWGNQKGGGRARHGNRRSNIFVGGGVAFSSSQ